MHGLDKEFKEMWAGEERYFDKYPGYIMTVLGPKADRDEMEKLAKMIREKKIRK
jgi:hypothetical protein